MSKLFSFLQRVADGGIAAEKVKAEWTSEGERKFFVRGEQLLRTANEIKSMQDGARFSP